MMDKLDKSYFRKGTVEQIDKKRKLMLSLDSGERLVQAYRLSLRAYGYDPDSPPKMDKTYFRKRKRD